MLSSPGGSGQRQRFLPTETLEWEACPKSNGSPAMPLASASERPGCSEVETERMIRTIRLVAASGFVITSLAGCHTTEPCQILTQVTLL